MTEKKYQFFLSSTFKDLIVARNEVMQAILSIYHIPIGMEMFSADNSEQWETISSTIDSSDYYILIIGHRYGSTMPNKISFTEKEFDYAIANGVPVLFFVQDRNAATKPEDRDTEPWKAKKLEAFVNKATTNRLVDMWTNESQLAQKVLAAIMKITTKTPRSGWVRADKAASPQILEELATLSKINRDLQNELDILKRNQLANKPKIGVSFKEEDGIFIFYDKSFLENINLIKPLSIESIKKYTTSYLFNKETIVGYNVSISNHALEVANYNDALYRYSSIEKCRIPFSVTIENRGSKKANEVTVDIKFPPEVLILNLEEIQKLQEPKRPSQVRKSPIDLEIDRRRQMDNRSHNDTIITIRGPKSPKTLLNESELKVLNNIYYNNSKENNYEIKDNTLTLYSQSLLHTRSLTFDEGLYIVPLEIGEFTATAIIICEEYEDAQYFEIPITIAEKNR